MCFEHWVRFKCGHESFTFLETCRYAERRSRPCKGGDGQDASPTDKISDWKDAKWFDEEMNCRCNRCDPANKTYIDKSFDKAKTASIERVREQNKLRESMKKKPPVQTDKDTGGKMLAVMKPSTNTPAASGVRVSSATKSAKTASKASESSVRDKFKPSSARPSLTTQAKQSTATTSASSKQTKTSNDSKAKPTMVKAPTSQSKTKASEPATKKISIAGRGGAPLGEDRDEFGYLPEPTLRGGASQAPSKKPGTTEGNPTRVPAITVQEPTRPTSGNQASKFTPGQAFQATQAARPSQAPAPSPSFGPSRGFQASNRPTVNTGAESRASSMRANAGTLRSGTFRPGTLRPDGTIEPMPSWSEFLPLTLQRSDHNDPAVAAKIKKAKAQYSKLFGEYEAEVKRALESTNPKDAHEMEQKMLDEALKMSAERYKWEVLGGAGHLSNHDKAMETAMAKSLQDAKHESTTKWTITAPGKNGASATVEGMVTTRSRVVPVPACDRTVRGTSKAPESIKPPAASCKPITSPTTKPTSNTATCKPAQVQPTVKPSSTLQPSQSHRPTLGTTKPESSTYKPTTSTQKVATERPSPGISASPQCAQTTSKTVASSPASCAPTGTQSRSSTGFDATTVGRASGQSVVVSGSGSKSKCPEKSITCSGALQPASTSTKPATSSASSSVAPGSTQRQGAVSRAPALLTVPEEGGASQSPGSGSRATTSHMRTHTQRNGDTTLTGISRSTCMGGTNSSSSKRPDATAAAAAAESRRTIGSTAATVGVGSRRLGGASAVPDIDEGKTVESSGKGKGRAV